MFQAFHECYFYLPENSGIANNYIFDNNTIYGLSEVAWDPMLLNLGHSNVTITNNRFLDIAWLDKGHSIAIDQVIISCPNKIYSKSIFENNTIGNRD